MGRIVLLGATGYTGGLIAERLVAGGDDPLLAGRSERRLAALAADLGGRCETATFDLERPASIAALLDPGDVLLTTVGSFLEHGELALRAAVERRAHYVDTTGEAPFIRRAFETAAGAQGAIVPAMGFNYAPGNLAGALAVERAGDEADRLDVGYFLTGEGRNDLSGGTLASATGVLMSPGFTRNGGRLRTERCGARVRRYDVDGRRTAAMTLGSSECLALPRTHPGIATIDVHQGGLGAATPIAAQAGRLAAVPGAARAIGAIGRRVFRGSTGGPDAATRARAGTHVAAIATSRTGHVLEEVVLRGPNVYDLTADLAVWGARRAVAGDVEGVGPMGPVEAFGLEPLRLAHEEAGSVER